MMSRARLRDDFIEFCRYAVLQIELMIDEFIRQLEKAGKISVTRGKYHNEIKKIHITNQENNAEEKKVYEGGVREKFQFCLDFMDNSVHVDQKSTQSKTELIKKIIKLRNLASHVTAHRKKEALLITER